MNRVLDMAAFIARTLFIRIKITNKTISFDLHATCWLVQAI